MTSTAAVADALAADDVPAVARRIAAEFAAGASTRDAERRLPHDEVRTLKRSGLLALSVPAEFGGLDAPATVVAQVFRTIAEADPSLAQIPQSHYTFLEALRSQGTAAQQEFFYSLVEAGRCSPTPRPNAARTRSTWTPPRLLGTAPTSSCRGASSTRRAHCSPTG